MGRGEPDPTGSYIAELKTVGRTDSDGSEKDIETMFNAQVIRYSYHLQAAWNREVIAELVTPTGQDQVRPGIYWIVVQTDDPYDVIVTQPPARALATATAKIRSDLERIDGCYRSGLWNGILEVEFPRWFEQKQLAEARANRFEIGE